MTSWALSRIQKVEMGRHEFKKKKRGQRERKVEKVLSQSKGKKISLRYLLKLLSKEWECVRADSGFKFQKNITAR